MPGDRPWTPADDDMIRAGRSGQVAVAFETLARQMGRSVGALWNRSVRLGITRPQPRITDEVVDRALAMREDEESWPTIAKALGFHPDNIKRACAKRLADEEEAERSQGVALPCLCCRATFHSVDRVANRLCVNCRGGEAAGLPVHW